MASSAQARAATPLCWHPGAVLAPGARQLGAREPKAERRVLRCPASPRHPPRVSEAQSDHRTTRVRCSLSLLLKHARESQSVARKRKQAQAG